MVELKKISKSYGAKLVLDNIDLEIKSGEVHALLGTNGAGKSTLINILAKLLPYDSGNIFMDKNPNFHSNGKKTMGFVFEEPIFIPYFSSKEYLEFVCELMELKPLEYRKKIMDIMAQLNLPTDHQPISSYSNGMKSKVTIAAALINSPEFLILDEPFNGVDFISCREIINILQSRAKEGTGVLITSHQFELIAELATHFSILHRSKIILSLTKSELIVIAGELYRHLPSEEAIRSFVERKIIEGADLKY